VKFSNFCIVSEETDGLTLYTRHAPIWNRSHNHKASALRVATTKSNKGRMMEMPGRLTVAMRCFLLFAPVLAVAACAYQEPPPPPAPVAAPAYPPGSPPAATTYYDGTYIGSFTQNASAPGSNCPNFPVAPALTIHNGVAQFAALNLTYQGSVTPQGEVRMQTPEGQTFVGQIDPHYVLRGQTTGACVYNAIWQRKEGTGPSPS
jgi:hypothetical protein